MPHEKSPHNEILSLTVDIVASHVSNNSVPVSELSTLIAEVYSTLSGLGPSDPVVEEKREPAVSVRRSVTPDYLICLEDGKQLKMLKRYLKTRYNLTPEEYRERWGLPADYPMVAPNYAEQRRTLAKKIGLGRTAKRRRK
ncbi:MAG: MucR family transcriptional regulator [Sphingomonadales bacterium]